MGEQFFIRSSGQIRGPFTREQLLDLRNRNRLQPFHEVSSDRISWAIASSLPEIFPAQIAAPQPGAAPTAALSYYTEEAGQRRGPFTREQLAVQVQNGLLHQESLAWVSGQGDWQALGQLLPDLFGLAGSFQFTSNAAVKWGSRWRTARIGMTLAIVATGIFAGAIAMFFLTVIIAVANSGPRAVHLLSALLAMTIVLVLTRLLVFVSQILETVAFGFCTAAPAGSGARGFAIATLVLAILSLLLDFIYFVSVLTGGSGWESNEREGWATAAWRNGYLEALVLTSLFALMAYRFLFLLFLRSSAAACRATTLAQSIIYLTILYVIVIFLSLVVFLVSYLSHSTTRTEGQAIAVLLGMMGSVLFALGVGWLAWYMVVLFQCHGKMGRDVG
jgi:hypothetical protein